MNLKNKLILHIPHSSINIPTMEGYLVDANSLANEMLKLTDWYTDDLFYSIDDEMIKAEFSRIFCDSRPNYHIKQYLRTINQKTCLTKKHNKN